MPEELYSENEALDRIYRILKGDAATLNEAPNTLVPPLNSTNEALSKIAELLAGTLEGEAAVVPSVFDDELTNEHGQISANANASHQTLVSGTWTKVAQFDALTVSTDGVTPSVSLDNIVTVEAGRYLLQYSLTFSGNTGTVYDSALVAHSTIQSNTYDRMIPTETGVFFKLQGAAFTAMNAADTAELDVRANKEGALFAVQHGYLLVHKML